VGKKLVVVLNVGGVIETDSWNELPDAILLAWQGGQEGGNAVADILMGVANPSGRLPMTFPVKVSDHASHANFPLEGKPIDFIGSMLGDGEKPEDEQIANEDYTNYEEGIYVGYRHFDKAGLPVAYPFGYGLSYTDFELSDLKVTAENDSISLVVTVRNIGEVAGKEVIQVYAAKPETNIDRPAQELKAFHKTKSLEPGESETLGLSFPVSDLRYWDETSSGWSLEKGSYTIKVGFSSRDIKLSETIEI
jgi:beta-glucosidase